MNTATLRHDEGLDLSRYRTDPAAFIDRFIPLNEKGRPWRLSDHQRRVLALALRWTQDGRLDRVRHVVWGEVKKSGKTMLAAAIGTWWAYTRSHTEVIVVANDLEQSIGRVFKTMAALIRSNRELEASATIRAASIELSNRTTITAIASDYRGAAGSRHSLVIVDEPWGFTSESAERLMEELTPPPTEPEAWIFMTSYAGFTGESVLLERLYDRGLQGERLDDALEVYRADDLAMFWSHTPRQPWQTPEYYAEQRRSLRPNAYLRLHENRWVTGTEAFITEAMWDGCVDDEHAPALPGRLPSALFVGVDAATKHDTAAAVAVYRAGDRLVLARHMIWKPTPSDPLDLEQTIEQWLRDCHMRWQVASIVCDPYQLHRSIMTLRGAGLPIREYPQTPANLTLLGQSLFELLNGRNLRLYPAADLRAQALNTVALESSRGWKVAKHTGSRKIDSVIALGMACAEALARPQYGPIQIVPLKGL